MDSFELDDQLVKRQLAYYGQLGPPPMILNAYRKRQRTNCRTDCISCGCDIGTISSDIPVRLNVAGEYWTCYECVERTNCKRQRVLYGCRRPIRRADVYLELRRLFTCDIAKYIMGFVYCPIPIRLISAIRTTMALTI